MHKDVLAHSVHHAFWSEAVRSEILDKVHERWKLVLDLFIAGKGGNNLVEKHRSLKAKLEDLPTLADSDDEAVVNSLLEQAECDIVDDNIETAEDGECDKQG